MNQAILHNNDHETNKQTTLFNECTQDGASSKKVCSYQDVLDHLNLTADNGAYKLTRPVLDHTQTTTVELDIILYAILSVVGASSSAKAAVLLNFSDARARARVCCQVEKTQMFVPFIWVSMVSDCVEG